MNSSHKYETTFKSIMEWANSELEHVGRIVAVHDPDLQYSYALSTVNGMAHLKDALYEMVSDEAYTDKKQELQRTHDAVIRVMKHLIKDFNVDLETIKKFNTRKVLSNLSYVGNTNKKNVRTNNGMNTTIRSPKNVRNVPNNYISNVNTLDSFNLKNDTNLTMNTNKPMNNLNNLNNLNTNRPTLNITNMNNLDTNRQNITTNSYTPTLRSSVITNANSMSQKLRGGKRRRNRSNKSRK